jgi:shikimate dehydrogenase
MRELDLDAVYVGLLAWEELVESLMRSVSRLGGGGNVTVPYKTLAADSLDHPSETVTSTGACNVFWWEEDRGLCGDNTDVEAFQGAAEALLGSGLVDKRVLLLGAGGAARAVAYACGRAKVEGLDIANRTLSSAVSLADELGGAVPIQAVDLNELESGCYDLVVNATSLGLAPSDPLPVIPRSLDSKALLDLVYGHDGTPLVRAAREAGMRAEDGRRVLVEQAAASFERWFRLDPPREVMYRTVELTD